ncbi:MAG: membrane protein insertase YidC [Clostridia bacterium]|nr:membrane protein insertase YidC [Clostridia bacterium]
MFSAVINVFGHILQILYGITEKLGVPNYGLAIIMMTVFIKIVLFPLTRKQTVAMAKMQEIQPEVQRIQKRYKDNPQKSQEEMMKVYKEHNVNPASGCLPLLIQLPILIALFRTLQSFFDPVRHPPFVDLDKASFLWVPNLGSPDPGFTLPIDIFHIPSIHIPYILPILVALGTFFQQYVAMRASKSSGAPGSAQQTQKVMLYFMPLFIGYISRTFPAGLALYWVFYSILGIIEQLAIRSHSRVVKEEAGTK